jgi:enamine deaminase RidA (YjgF/YER057c/UK114 family)
MRDFMEYISTEGVHRSGAFSQAISVSAAARTVYIGGQNAVNAVGEIVGRGDLRAQTRQALENIKRILAAAGATFENVVKLNIFLVQGQDPREGFAAFMETVGPLAHPPLITVAFVAALANPDFLVEIDGVAAVEEPVR